MQRLLVANRGEIAMRIFRACRPLGIATVAVVAPDDRGSLHARSADVTVEIASYLDPAEHVRAAHESGADAVHPGYGFLSESADLADAVLGAGLTWVGPPPAALRAGGDKLAAKRTARDAGVPVLPNGSPDELGYPLLVKAAAGGGGRGMRIVRASAELDDAVDAARREAAAAFGDDTVFFERYLERPRHVEIQLLADRHGTVLALGERDCSIQRRHQKVLEESPSPALDPELRARMSDAAVAFARAIGYESAGTAEFVLDGRDFFFLELNARIQVEHPVTELVTGLDIVREQLRIADGERLELDVALHGHAIEVRLYAEDPRTFLPQAGRDRAARLPQGVRVDAGVEQGDEIGTSYDPMIAKLIAHGSTRDEALDRLAAGAARDGRRRADDESPVPALARLASARARRPDDHGLPHREPAAVRGAVPRTGARLVRLLAAQPPRPAAAGGSRHRRLCPRTPLDARAGGAHGADARHGHPRARRARANTSPRASRSSCSRR